MLVIKDIKYTKVSHLFVIASIHCAKFSLKNGIR